MNQKTEKIVQEMEEKMARLLKVTHIESKINQAGSVEADLLKNDFNMAYNVSKITQPNLI